MAMETDADRLAMLQAIGVRVSAPGGHFWAIFKRDYQLVSADDIGFESRQPALTCRTSDVVVRAIGKDQIITGLADDAGAPITYRVVRHEPDGTGMSVVFLRI